MKRAPFGLRRAGRQGNKTEDDRGGQAALQLRSLYGFCVLATSPPHGRRTPPGTARVDPSTVSDGRRGYGCLGDHSKDEFADGAVHGYFGAGCCKQ